VGLAYIEDHCFISKNIQIQAIPIRRALVNEQETLERNDNMLAVHGMVLSHIELVQSRNFSLQQ
jgi:hypothetical protein